MILIDSLRSLATEAQNIARSLECMHIANDGFECLSRRDLRRCGKGVYFIATEGANAVKVGLSKSVTKRMSALQLANPHRLKIWRFINCANYEKAKILEKSLQKYFTKQGAHIRGEWFLMDAVAELFDEEVVPMVKQNMPDATVIDRSEMECPLAANHEWARKLAEEKKTNTPKS